MHEAFHSELILLHLAYTVFFFACRGMPCSYNIAAKEKPGVDVRSHIGFNPTNPDVMANIWADLWEDGLLDAVRQPHSTFSSRHLFRSCVYVLLCSQSLGLVMSLMIAVITRLKVRRIIHNCD